MGVDDTPVQIVAARATEAFCITAILLKGNKNISTSIDSVVTIYEATADDLTANLNDLFVLPVSRSGDVVLSGILVEVPKGRFVMGKASDDDVYVTILGFYV
jgi:hypothetical protein